MESTIYLCSVSAEERDKDYLVWKSKFKDVYEYDLGDLSLVVAEINKDDYTIYEVKKFYDVKKGMFILVIRIIGRYDSFYDMHKRRMQVLESLFEEISNEGEER